MATKTSTSTNTSISQKGDVFVVKEVKTKTTTSPGKDPVVETTETVTEYKGKDNLPEHIRKQLDDRKVDGPINMAATRGNFPEDILKEVNKYRKLHGVAPLKLSPKLVEHCEGKAKQMAERDDMHDPSDNDEYGGSVTCMSSNDPEFYVKADAVVTRWYSGSSGYDYSVEPDELTAGHFTQMVWKSSQEMGVAAAKSKTNQVYVVACFNPRGNYINKFLENVCPPVSKSSIIGNGAKSFFNIFDRKKFQDSAAPQKKQDMSHFNKEGVECHNKYRKLHGVPALKYNKELADYAQAWANALAQRDIFEHRTEGKFGENLYYSYNSDPNVVAKPSDACDSWYSEIQYYTFGQEPLTTRAGHFTQMIWKDTKEVGMGMAKSKSGKQYIVANYNPPGNYIGRYTQNIPKPI